MLKTFLQSLMALTLAVGMTASSIGSAEARHGRGGGLAFGLAAGIIGLGIAGAIANEHRRDRRPYYYSGGGERCRPGPEQCGWTDRHCFENDWGDTVCRGGRYTCWRPTYCD